MRPKTHSGLRIQSLVQVRCLWSLLLSLGFSIVARSGPSDVLLIQFSDSHSNLPGLVTFLKTVPRLAERHLRDAPHGRVVIVPTGDIAGADEWSSRDGGEWVYRALAALAQRYSLVTVLGNHEAFDFVGTRFERGYPANHFFLEQTLRFNALTGQRLLAANARTMGQATDLIGSHQDVVLPNGHTIRFVGLVTPKLIASSGYDTRSSLQYFDGFDELLPTAQRELVQAARDRVQTVLFPVHEELLYVRPFVDRLAQWKQSRPDLDSVAVPLVMAGHDHLVRRERRSNVVLVDSGADFAFTAIRYDPDERVVTQVRHWSLDMQERYLETEVESNLDRGIRAVISGIEREIDDVRSENSRVLSTRRVRLESSKQDLERGPVALGTALADALVSWAHERRGAVPREFALEGVVGFFNSTSFRRESTFTEPVFRLIDLRSMIPFDMFTRLRVMRGEHVQQVFRAIRLDRSKKQAYSPQLSSGWSEGPGLTLLHEGAPIRAEGLYLLAVDHFTSRNGYDIPAVAEAFDEALWAQSESDTIFEVMQRHLPTRLECEFAFQRDRLE